MKALTLWRPWSDAIVRGPKRVENRPWAPPGRVLGQVIAIHAGQKYSAGPWEFPGGYEPPDESPLGVVGVARVVGYLDRRNGRHQSESALLHDEHYAELAARLHALNEDEWWAGPVGWLLDQVRAIEPVPCRGALGLWQLPVDVEAEVRRRLAA